MGWLEDIGGDISSGFKESFSSPEGIALNIATLGLYGQASAVGAAVGAIDTEADKERERKAKAEEAKVVAAQKEQERILAEQKAMEKKATMAEEEESIARDMRSRYGGRRSLLFSGITAGMSSTLGGGM